MELTRSKGRHLGGGGVSSPLGGPGAAREGAWDDLRGFPWATPFRVGSGKERGKDVGIRVVARPHQAFGPSLNSSQFWLSTSQSRWLRPVIGLSRPGPTSRWLPGPAPIFQSSHRLLLLATPSPSFSPSLWSCPLNLYRLSSPWPSPALGPPHWLRPHFCADSLELLGSPSPTLTVRARPLALSTAMSPEPREKVTLRVPPPPQPSFFTRNCSLWGEKGAVGAPPPKREFNSPPHPILS